MKSHIFLGCLVGALALAGCASPSHPTPPSAAAAAQAPLQPLLEKQFVLEVLRHVYRWHFDQAYILEPGKLDSLEVWARPLHPKLDAGDRSEFAELWIPAANTRVELKRSDYRIPEMNLDVVDGAFKVERVTRQPRAPAARAQYEVARYDRAEVQEFLFATRTNQVPMTETLRTATRKLIVEYLNKTHPEAFTEDQILYVAPVSPVCNDLWAFWETGRKLMLFSADMDLANPGFAQLSQLRLEVIDLDKDVVASTREVPGSNAFVTKDWVGRIFFNCILYGERLVRTPAEMNQIRANPGVRPTLQPRP
jgi:hypothetical protein